MEKQQLNNLVVEYVNSRNEQTFNEIYAEVIGKQRGKLGTIGKSIRADRHEALALYEDTLMKCIERYDGKSDFENFFNWSVVRSRTDTYRKKKRLAQFEEYDAYNGSDSVTAAGEEHWIPDYFINKNNTEDTTAATVLSTKRADQRKLIDSLLNGADETTTAIVEAFLAHPKPTATAIAKELGCHHSKVLRALTRLAANYSTKQFGNYHDYLVAL